MLSEIRLNVIIRSHGCYWVISFNKNTQGRPALPQKSLPDVLGWKYSGNRILPETLPKNPHPDLNEFFDYYRMPLGFHVRAVNSTGAWTTTMPLAFMAELRQ